MSNEIIKFFFDRHTDRYIHQKYRWHKKRWWYQKWREHKKWNDIKNYDNILNEDTTWYMIWLFREATKKKDKKWKKSKMGGGVSAKFHIVHNSKFLLFYFLGVPIFKFFPYVNMDFECFSWTKNKLVLNGFLKISKYFKLMFFSDGGPKIHNFLNLGWWGKVNYGFCPLFVTFLLFN